ncbi:MAG: excinuclease ABC subunit UvrA [Vampirovibrionales bacterium]|nr:excinuclease ABC subunit UvrA [Vampirovibrionales bacterium]
MKTKKPEATEPALKEKKETVAGLAQTAPASKPAIHIQGARVHNLKNVSCDLPLEKLTVITGPSGSGKSSLAFDTLYAEGQRRFIESMSSYARQFLARIEKPDVDKIEHILPAIALEQKNSVKNARMTVGTATEIDDYVRVLMAALGKTHCSVCGHTEVSRANPARIEQAVLGFDEGTKLLLLSPIHLKEVSLDDVQAKGFVRVLHQQEMIELTPESKTRLLSKVNEHETLYVVIDRLVVRKNSKNQKSLGARLVESIQHALTLGNGKIEIRNLDTSDTHVYQSEYACLNCHTAYPEPFPNLFSFNSPLGACPSCEGFGRIIGLDLDKVVPNKKLSLKEHAVHPFSTPANEEMYTTLMAECKKRKIPVTKPYAELSDEQKTFVIEGGGDYYGIRPFFDWLETKKYKVHVRVMLAKYRGYYLCPECMGSRLQKNALNVYLLSGNQAKNMLDIGKMTIGDLQAFFKGLTLNDHERLLSERLLQEIENRLDYLNRIGLSYLTLSRQARTLSGGESQRIHLSSALGSRLTDTLYVLDEPTVGLHARDTDRLLGILRALRDHGNTVIVVEHDPDMMLNCDHIVDMGPGGGEEGGRILYEGSPKGLLSCKISQTGRFLSQPKLALSKKHPSSGLPPKGEGIRIIGARGNNLKNLTVAFPKNTLVCVSGVSGSGKSTLIKQTLFTAYEHSHGQSLQLDAAPCDAIEGLEGFSEVLMIDQSPPGRSARSNPLTYVKAYDDIRTLMAGTRKAKILGITPSDFSFNSVGGRCEACEGLGTVTIDMQFMADVTMTCPDCGGKRFAPNVLSVELEPADSKHSAATSLNIHGILEMTVDEAVVYFEPYPKIMRKLLPLQEIGLGYLRLGQATATLSGGEAQRLKLASYLKDAKPDRGNQKPVLFLFDEPTTGLHMADIYRLVEAFRRILAAGHSLIVIEHNIDFIAQCDYIIDLGPEGGETGGYIVAEGSVEEMIAAKQSETGKYLKQRLYEALSSSR